MDNFIAHTPTTKNNINDITAKNTRPMFVTKSVLSDVDEAIKLSIYYFFYLFS